jgi:2,4-dienoyl-CoA reductase-like NADH-dependent reductase (Old Yellow Enzyme family)
MPVLSSPITLGTTRLSHRFAIAPMTRSRADADGTPDLLAAEYHAQRSSLGLLITEGTSPAGAR